MVWRRSQFPLVIDGRSAAGWSSRIGDALFAALLAAAFVGGLAFSPGFITPAWGATRATGDITHGGVMGVNGGGDFRR